jgi:hypothetical protein
MLIPEFTCTSLIAYQRSNRLVWEGGWLGTEVKNTDMGAGVSSSVRGGRVHGDHSKSRG